MLHGPLSVSGFTETPKAEKKSTRHMLPHSKVKCSTTSAGQAKYVTKIDFETLRPTLLSRIQFKKLRNKYVKYESTVLWTRYSGVLADPLVDGRRGWLLLTYSQEKANPVTLSESLVSYFGVWGTGFRLRVPKDLKINLAELSAQL